MQPNVSNEIHSNFMKHAVILVNYNGLDYSLECIKSILEVENNNEIIIILVDNASKHNESQIIKNQFPNVVVINSKVNSGFSAGNNLAIQYAMKQGFEYITLLNNDTVVAPDMFIRLEEYCSNTNATTPKMYYFNSPNTIWYGGGNLNRKTGNAEHIHMNCEDVYDNNPTTCTFATGCCLMVKADLFSMIGLLEESYFMYCEDTDFCIRLLLAGLSITYVPQAKLWHKVSTSTGGSDSPFSTYYMTRNRLNSVKKYKDFFDRGAYLFSLFSRVVRMFETKDKDVRIAFKKAIKDHLNGIEGRSEFY